MLFQVFSLLCVLHASIIPAAVPPTESSKELIIGELRQDADLAIANNDVKSLEILLSLNIPNFFSEAQFEAAITSGSDKLVKAMLKSKKASLCVSQRQHHLIVYAHKIGRSVPILADLLKASNAARFKLCCGSFSSSSSEQGEEETSVSSDHEKMVTVARLAGLHDLAETFKSGTNKVRVTAEAACLDRSNVLGSKIIDYFNVALRNHDLDVILMLGDCAPVVPYIPLAVQSSIEEKNYSMIEALCKIPSFDITRNNFEAARLAASLELPFKIMKILLIRGKNCLRIVSVDPCVTVSVENELISVLMHLSSFVQPPSTQFGLERISSDRAKRDPNSFRLVELIETALTKPSAIELLQVLLDENRPFIKEVTVNLKMRLLQNLIHDAHKSGKHVLRDEMLKLAIRAHSNLSKGFDCREFAALETIIRGVDSLIQFCMLGPVLNQDVLRGLLNTLFNVAFA